LKPTEMLNYRLLLIVMSTIVLSSCARTLEPSKVEDAIKADLTQQSDLSIKSFTCPSNVKIEPGSTFECAGELKPNGGFYVLVKQEDAARKVSWEVPNSWRLLNLAKLETEFKQKLQDQKQPELRVNCGGVYRATKPGDSFECKLLRKDKSDVVLVRVEPEGKVTWQEVRTLAAKPPTATAQSAATTNPSTPEASDSARSQLQKPTPGAYLGVKDQTGWAELGD
jgi:Domain of unknown function (DUF4333)